jgi:hypothetical protein
MDPAARFKKQSATCGSSFEMVRICWAWAVESLGRPESVGDSATSKGKIQVTVEMMGRMMRVIAAR